MLLDYFSGCRIMGSELDYSAPGGENWYFSGKIDCLLEDRDGRGVILDFKLSAMPSKKSCTGGGGRGLEDFQLPMYITLAEKKGNKPVHTALFISILQAKPQVLFGFIQSPKKAIPGRSKARIERDAGEPNQFHAILGEFQEKARQYAGEVSQGNFTVFSPGGRRCAACDYHRICRTLYSVDQERDPALGPIQVQPAPPAGKEALHG
jgi:hypothetical protein